MSLNKLYPSPNSSNTSILNETANKFECNIFLCDRSVCLDKKQANTNAWNSHIERIDQLAKPKKKHDVVLCECDNNSKIKKVSLNQLMPRIKILSKPRRITPKYVKQLDEEYEAKKITNWEAHKKWLEKHTKPKENTSIDCSTICRKSKRLSKEGWRRLTELAKPRASSCDKTCTMTNRKVATITSPTARICQLSKPKIQPNVDNCKSYTRVSTTALTYCASERIKQLAMPKYNNIRESESQPRGDSGNNLCCSISFDNLYCKSKQK